MHTHILKYEQVKSHQSTSRLCSVGGSTQSKSTLTLEEHANSSQKSIHQVRSHFYCSVIKIKNSFTKGLEQGGDQKPNLTDCVLLTLDRPSVGIWQVI